MCVNIMEAVQISPRPIDQDRRLHLPTSSDSRDPIGAVCYFRDDTPDTEDSSHQVRGRCWDQPKWGTI
jgi:hypothetical protein